MKEEGVRPPAITVVLTTYNRARMLAEALASVQAQTFRDFETVVIDDDSEDDTPRVVASSPGVRYVRQQHAGVAAARNRGVNLARGDFVAFLDSDDLWRPHKLARQIAFFSSHPGFMLCQTKETWVRNGRVVNPRRYHEKPDGWIFLPSLERCLISPSAVMLRRSLLLDIGGFDETLPACEDYDLWLRIALRFPVGLVGEPLVIKRGGHPDQLSRHFSGMDRFRLAALCKLIAGGGLSGVDKEQARATLETKAEILARGARKRGRLEEAARYLALAAWTREIAAS